MTPFVGRMTPCVLWCSLILSNRPVLLMPNVLGADGLLWGRGREVLTCGTWTFH
jgi:hypothetical protein